jgi:hypothetical protein
MAEKSASLGDTETCNIPSNEEIINELTKDLHSACINTTEKDSSIDSELNCRKSDQTTNNVGISEEKDETNVTPGCTGNEPENEKGDVRDEDDIIDEEAMKAQENMYTEEDKEVLDVCTCLLGSEVRSHYTVMPIYSKDPKLYCACMLPLQAGI